MVSRQRIEKALALLERHLPSSPEVQASLEHLRQVCENQNWPKEVGADPETFPIPDTVSKAGGIALFSDGACRGNPGPGSWGMLGQNALAEQIFESSGVEMNTTNNRMEMMGAIEALKAAAEYCADSGQTPPLWLYSDGRYVVDGMNSWIKNWKARGWKKADGKPPENIDLWRELDRVSAQFEKLTFVWVKGHAGHPQNEYCDRIANLALDDAGF